MSEDFVPTKASLLTKKAQKDYEQVTYVAYKSKKKEKLKEVNEAKAKVSELEFNLKKAKQEITKLGISGFDLLKKEEAKIQQLIKLGAKPPKNKYVNYKQLVNQRKGEKEKQAKEQMFQQLGKNSAGKSIAKGKSFDKKRKKDGILDIYGKILKNKVREEKSRK